MISKLIYGIAELLFYITLKLEELFYKMRISLHQYTDKRLDKIYNIETLAIPNTTYIPIATQIFRLIFSSAEMPANIRFFDYGSGKGKALILASELGFEKIGGIELSSELVEISQKNIMNYASKLKKEVNINVICADATGYDDLDDYNVFFFNNSFGGNPSEERIVAKIFKKIEASMKRNSRHITIIYVHPGITLQLLFKSYDWLNHTKIIRNTRRPKYDSNANIFVFNIFPKTEPTV